MTQFTVYRNKNPRSRTTFPFLVNVQSDLLDELQTRVVIPLTRAAALTRKPVGHLMPTVQFEGEAYVLMTPQLAGVARSEPSRWKPCGAAGHDCRGNGLSAVGILKLKMISLGRPDATVQANAG